MVGLFHGVLVLTGACSIANPCTVSSFRAFDKHLTGWLTLSPQLAHPTPQLARNSNSNFVKGVFQERCTAYQRLGLTLRETFSVRPSKL